MLILGSGQLGLMMAAAAARLGASVDRLDLATDELLPGTSTVRLPAPAVGELLGGYEVITVELEHLPDSALVNALRESPKWINDAAFRAIADRASQKAALDSIGVATAPWRSLDQPADLDATREALGGAVVAKITRGGYDGRGQWVMLTASDQAPPADAFGQLIAEQWIPFDREVSLVAARGADGATCFLPLAENVHVDGILRYSIVHHGRHAALQAQAEAMLGKIMDHFGYVGVMAMECFDVDGQLMVNELAPRVHNSGHWSQLGAAHDQFALHVRAVQGLPLPAEQPYRATLMLNLIGCHFEPRWTALGDVQCHWYGKTFRPGRKLGHINLPADDPQRLSRAATALRPTLDAEHAALLDAAVARTAAPG